MGQGGDRLAEHFPISGDIGGSHFQEIVESAGDHVRGLNLWMLENRRIKGVQRIRSRIVEGDLNERNMRQAEAVMIQISAVSPDHSGFLHPPDPRQRGRFAEADLVAQGRHRNLSITGQDRDDLAIYAV